MIIVFTMGNGFIKLSRNWVDPNMLSEKETEIWPAYISKCNSNCKKQTTLLMIPNKKRKHY